MPRIRTIKPEFWDSPGTARASYQARLFFIAMWNWADDYGIGTANPRQLIGFAFPTDDEVTEADFPRLRTEVSECFDVQWYEVDGRPYYAIPSWERHQKNERRAKGKHPTPDQGKRVDAEMRGISVQSRGRSGPGTGEQGNRGTGEFPAETQASTSLAEPVDSPHRVEDEPRSAPVNASASAIAREYTSRVKLSDKGKVAAVVWGAIGAGYTEDQIRAGLRTLAGESRPVTPDTLRIAIEGKSTPATPPKPKRTIGREGW